MVNFLLTRPIAVTMTFIGLIVMGIIASGLLPVSLMPDVDIPKITVNVSVKNASAREIENTVVKQLRHSMMQVSKLADIKSETMDGSATIKLDFEYGANIDLAFIEVNEKIDLAMANLPRDTERPKVIKASATDIPVFYLNLTLKDKPAAGSRQSAVGSRQSAETRNDLFPVSQEFAELSDFANQVIQKRIEQLPQVALADISGCTYPEILIIPDMEKLNAIGITVSTIERSLMENNVTVGNLLIRDGQYQYNVRLGNHFVSASDIGNVYLRATSRLLQLKDIAAIIEHPQKRRGLVVSDGKDAISIAVVKQSDARMSDLKEGLEELLSYFEKDYPTIDFTVTRDQTKLLDYSIQNMNQSLIMSAFLAFIIMFFFLKEFRSPLLIGLTIPTSLLISLFFFYLMGISLNIVSLSGLVLGVGMMVDNSIIVIDNINQHRERGISLFLACVKGTNEVFVPMLSGVLTTCAVFIPLVFISGISGALFYDQAIAVTIGLFASLLVAVTLLPVYFHIVYKRNPYVKENTFLARMNRFDYAQFYEHGMRFVFRHQRFAWLMVLFMLLGAVYLFTIIDKERFPAIAQTDTLLKIDWNERITIDENNRRVQLLVTHLEQELTQNTCYVGEQQFLMDHNSTKSGSEAIIYMKAATTQKLDTVIKQVTNYLSHNFDGAVYSFEDVGNIFNLLFADNEKSLEARLRAVKELGFDSKKDMEYTLNSLQKALPTHTIEPIVWQEQVVVKTDANLLALYDISFDQVYRALRRSFSEYEVLVITENQNFLPVIIGDKPKLISDVLNTVSIENNQGQLIPIRTLFKTEMGYGLKEIVAGKEGEYYPVTFDAKDNEVSQIIKAVDESLKSDGNFEAGYFGTFFSSRKLINELAVIMGISLLLLYFILASQFENMWLPLIILLEIPIDLFGALLVLKVFGSSINLMSMIGMVVMTGIVVNDSILKIDTTNALRAEGYGLLHAIMVAGQRRLKPILMTSITAILGLLPFFFIQGLGADLQRPLAYAIIGGLGLGTIVTLFFIPLCYYYLIKFQTKK